VAYRNWGRFFPVHQNVSARGAGPRLDVTHRRAARNAVRFADRIGRAAVVTGQAGEPLGELRAGSGLADFPFHHLPNFFGQLQVLDILGNIVQAAQQVHRVEKRGDCRLAKAGGHAHPLLLADLHHHAVLDLLDINRQRGLPAGARELAGGNLDREMVALAQHLGAQVALVVFCHQGLRDGIGGDVTVVDALFHICFGYNRNAFG
jgi:hypothetical protein